MARFLNRLGNRAKRRLYAGIQALLGAPAALLRLPGRIRSEPAVREHALATIVFSGIFAFTVFSLDALVTGAGPDWDPGAMAAPPSHIQRMVPITTVAPVEASTAVEDAAPAAEPTEEIAISAPLEDLLGGPNATVWASYRPDSPLEAAPASEAGLAAAVQGKPPVTTVATPLARASKNKGVSVSENA